MATPEQQARIDRSEIKIRLIRNGVLVKTKNGWFTFPSWEAASPFIGESLRDIEQ